MKVNKYSQTDTFVRSPYVKKKFEKSLERLLDFCFSKYFYENKKINAILSQGTNNNNNKSEFSNEEVSKRFGNGLNFFGRLFGVDNTNNPIAESLLLSSLLKLDTLYSENRYKDIIAILRDELIDNSLRDESGISWKYPIDSISSKFNSPRNSSAFLPTILVARSFLDLYEVIGDDQDLSIIKSIQNFLLRNVEVDQDGTIHWKYLSDVDSYDYSTTILGAGFLAGAASVTQMKDSLDVSKKVVSHVCRKQMIDGSWTYGSEHRLKPIDSLQMAFILWGIKDYIDYSSDKSFLSNLEDGYEYYKHKFVLTGGEVKKFHHKSYPMNIICSAAAIITLVRLGDVSYAIRVAEWAIDNMQEDVGYFFNSKSRFWRIKNLYVGSTQFWMALALSELLSILNNED